MNAEQQRLRVNAAKKIPLEQWGPYLSERQWGTVREDYSENSDAWNYLRKRQWGAAARNIFDRRNLSSLKAVWEDRRWIRGV